MGSFQFRAIHPLGQASEAILVQDLSNQLLIIACLGF